MALATWVYSISPTRCIPVCLSHCPCFKVSKFNLTGMSGGVKHGGRASLHLSAEPKLCTRSRNVTDLSLGLYFLDVVLNSIRYKDLRTRRSPIRHFRQYRRHVGCWYRNRNYLFTSYIFCLWNWNSNYNTTHLICASACVWISTNCIIYSMCWWKIKI